MNDRRFARKIKRMARIQTRRGNMTDFDFDRIVKGCKSPEVVKQWRAKLEQPVYGAPWVGPGVAKGIDWTSVWAWLKDNWPTILKLLLSILVFLGENPDEDTQDTYPRDSQDEGHFTRQRRQPLSYSGSDRPSIRFRD
jgi:hypothetical protein